MSTKYKNMSIKVAEIRPAEGSSDPVYWLVVVTVEFTRSIPRLPGHAKARQGQCLAKPFKFGTESAALGARAMLEEAFDAMLPAVTQFGVLDPVEERPELVIATEVPRA